MPRRSTRIKLSNNTDFPLRLLETNLCHGVWTDGPNGEMQAKEIASKTSSIWESESSGIGVGTAGWVKFLIQNPFTNVTRLQPCPPELVYIGWDNPFVWDHDTTPYDPKVRYTSDINPPCPTGNEGSTFRFTPASSMPPPECRFELFFAGATGTGWSEGFSYPWYSALATLPLFVVIRIVEAVLFGLDSDINLEFTFGLRQEGSVDQTILSFYDGSRGLRSLAEMAGQTSLRRLFQM